MESEPQHEEELVMTPAAGDSVRASESSDEKHLLLGDDTPYLESSTMYSRRQGTRTSWLIAVSVGNVLMSITSISLFSIWYYNTHFLPNAGLRQVSSYKPSIARQMPNKKADRAWLEYEWDRVIPVTADDIRKMGKDPSTVAKLENEIYGLGDDAYATIFDVYHQLHCLNRLRRQLYPDRYDDKEDKHFLNAVKGMNEIHMNHCVDLLFQTIRCSGNLNLITMHWVEQEPWPFPDMSVNRQCIDFDQLTEWRLKNSVDLDTYIENSAKPPGVKQLPAPDAYYKFFNPNNLTNPNHINGAHPDEDFNL
ncbi:tat pathway signal sequence [Fusarium longipes]|uniref:Tat pathway signal sequence n=1 Tax=Fusarium longipes TaxID=694270 RepID=A0A395T488_9HYPO|nr:tat pathway signal sequence [Fusarium longipes]